MGLNLLDRVLLVCSFCYRVMTRKVTDLHGLLGLLAIMVRLKTVLQLVTCLAGS